MRQVWCWSVSMVTIYDVISSWSSKPFWSEMHDFSTSFLSKPKLVAEMTQSTYSCVILHVKLKQLSIFAVCTWFLILEGQDGDHVWWHHRPPAAPPPIKYTSSCREDQRLSIEGKIVLKYCNISKLKREVPSTPPPLPRTCTTVGIWICVYFRGLILLWLNMFSSSPVTTQKSKQLRGWFLYSSQCL